MSGIFQVEIIVNGVRRGEQHIINNIVREALAKMGGMWREEYLPIHFTRKAFYRYSSYVPRSGDYGSGKPFKRSYAQNKKRKYPANAGLPNVYSGEARSEALQSKKVISTATSKRARAECPLPLKFNFKNPISNVHPVKEMTEVVRVEIRAMEKALAEWVAEGMTQMQTEREFGIRIAA